MQDLTGSQLGDYTILRRIGSGAMAQVYLAEQRSLARRVALKILSDHLASNEDYVARFQQEARAAAALVHAGIVQIYEVGVAQGRHYIAQEYVAGSDLGELLERHGPLAPGVVLDILRQAAAALCKAEQMGIVHRDIKPENLMLASTGEVKVADFGLARAAEGANKLTQVGVTMGTPLYMSPEQIEGANIDARSDIYSLGVTAYHLLAGEPPFQGETPLAVAMKHLNQPPQPLAQVCPETPAAMLNLVERMMAKRPGDRFASPAELLAELRDRMSQAVAEGWAKPPEDWSLLKMSPLDGGAEAARLTHAMHEQSKATAGERSGRKRLAVASIVLVALLVGSAIGVAVRPARLLDDAAASTPEKEDVLRQLYHAQMIDSEDAWRAVERYFPNVDPTYHYLAARNLIRLHLRREQFDAARQLSNQLASLGDNYADYRLCGLAGLVVCHDRLGNREAAEDALNRLPTDAATRLQRIAPEIAELLSAARQRM